MVGPAVGGVLYTTFGFRGPFIFGISAAFLDLVARLMVIERKEAILWNHDPAASTVSTSVVSEGASTQPVTAPSDTEKGEEHTTTAPQDQHDDVVSKVKHLTLLEVLGKLIRSKRADIAFVITLIYA